MTPDPTVSQVAAQPDYLEGKVRGVVAFLECCLRLNSAEAKDWIADVDNAALTLRNALAAAPTQEPAGEPAELAEFRAWKADRDEQARTRGRYCLTPEGRAEVRRIFDADDWVFVLLDEVERLEAAIDAAASPQPHARKGKK